MALGSFQVPLGLERRRKTGLQIGTTGIGPAVQPDSRGELGRFTSKVKANCFLSDAFLKAAEPHRVVNCCRTSVVLQTDRNLLRGRQGV